MASVEVSSYLIEGEVRIMSELGTRVLGSLPARIHYAVWSEVRKPVQVGQSFLIRPAVDPVEGDPYRLYYLKGGKWKPWRGGSRQKWASDNRVLGLWQIYSWGLESHSGPLYIGEDTLFWQVWCMGEGQPWKIVSLEGIFRWGGTLQDVLSRIQKNVGSSRDIHGPRYSRTCPGWTQPWPELLPGQLAYLKKHPFVVQDV